MKAPRRGHKRKKVTESKPMILDPTANQNTNTSSIRAVYVRLRGCVPNSKDGIQGNGKRGCFVDECIPFMYSPGYKATIINLRSAFVRSNSLLLS